MNKHICKYSIIRFQPYPETEEFANIGIVLYVPASKRLEFRLLDDKYKRITDFFDPMSKDIFKKTLKVIRAEIERIKKFLNEAVGVDIDLYTELTRPREDIVRFSENRVLFSNDPLATIDGLFEHYVQRNFLNEPSYEETLKKRMRDLLSDYKLDHKYKDDTIGEPDKYEVRFPFVCKSLEQSVIKPIHFTHEKPSQLIDHGNAWLAKVQQLDRFKFIKPNQILFAYEAPKKNQVNLFEAFNEIKGQAQKIGVVMIDINAADKIAEFATH